MAMTGYRQALSASGCVEEEDDVSTHPGRRSRPTRYEPRRLPDSARKFEGSWVALDGDEVIAAAHNARELVAKLHEMGPRSRKAITQYIPRPSDVITIGIG